MTKSHRIAARLIAIEVIILGLIAMAPFPLTIEYQVPTSLETPHAPASSGQLYLLYLPIVIQDPKDIGPAPSPSPNPTPDRSPQDGPSSVFGLNMYTTSIRLKDINQTEVSWIRPDPILWSAIEPKRGDRNWGVLAGLEEELRFAAKSGVEPVVIVTGTPGWAQEVSGSECGPIKEKELASFALFMADLVSRYSKPPYAVKYWELWNEPDVDPIYSSLSTYGCWGDQYDPYFGGGYYAKMLKIVYPAIKSANSAAQVLVGGLLLGCDPRHPDFCNGGNAGPGKFLEGILRGGGAPYFDGVSFHAFDGYAGIRGLYGNANWGSAWDTNGPVFVAKIAFLQEMLANYGATNKYLICTEAAVKFYSDECDQDCEMTKAYYMPQLYAATLAEGIKSTLWYCASCSWANVDLFDANGNPLPAYKAYQAAWSELNSARYIRQVALDDHVRIYEFERGNRTVWALWALDQMAHTLQLPRPPSAALSVLGDPIPAVGNQLSVTLEPVYLEWVR